MPRSASLIALLLLALPARAAAQVIQAPDSATLLNSAAHSALTYWEATVGSADQQGVFLRNNSTRPIQVLKYEVYECNNIPHKTCGMHTPGPVIAPGKTVTLVTISRLRDNLGWSYRYRYWVDFVPDSTAAPRP